MSNNTDFSDDPRVIFPSQSSENAVNPEEDRRAPNSAAENSSGDTSLTVEEVEFELDAMFGESYSQEFKERTQELLARAVLTATESIQVELASEYQDRINALERELALRECCQGMALTDRERFRAQTEHI